MSLPDAVRDIPSCGVVVVLSCPLSEKRVIAAELSEPEPEFECRLIDDNWADRPIDAPRLA